MWYNANRFFYRRAASIFAPRHPPPPAPLPKWFGGCAGKLSVVQNSALPYCHIVKYKAHYRRARFHCRNYCFDEKSECVRCNANRFFHRRATPRRRLHFQNSSAVVPASLRLFKLPRRGIAKGRAVKSLGRRRGKSANLPVQEFAKPPRGARFCIARLRIMPLQTARVDG